VRAVSFRGRTLEVVLVLALLWFASPVVVPVVLSFYLAFVLAPPCSWLERRGLPRWAATTLVFGAALAAVGVVGGVLVSQVLDLAAQLKTYSAQMSEKLAGIRDGRLQVVNDLSAGFAELSRRIDPETAAELSTPVRIVSGSGSTFGRIGEAVGPVLEPIAVALFVLVITIFIVARREDLRGRLIQLMGPKNVTVTTQTLGEAMTRVGHLLLTQVYINAAFAVLVALGLYAIGVPYALLWGVLAGILRFVPLVGGWIAGAFPALVAFTVFPGWREAALTVAFFLVTEIAVANFVEPLVLGKRTGVSALALLVAALFWTWMWGPLGLVLATPITVCAAVVGRHVPHLAFLAVAFGDEPGLNAELDFYQRLLSGAARDAALFAKRRAAETSPAQTFDQLLVPALALLSSDLDTRTIGAETAARVAKDIDAIARRLASTRESVPTSQPPVLGITCVPLFDAPILQMLRVALASQHQAIDILEVIERTDALARAVERQPQHVFVAALPPGGNVNARFLCRRLRAELPHSTIVAIVPELTPNHSQEMAARLREAGASSVVHSVHEAVLALTQHEGGGSGGPLQDDPLPAAVSVEPPPSAHGARVSHH
jgi:predicted PurR-regulated permease PerM